MVYRIFVVEDDRGIADALQDFLEGWNMQVHCVQDFRNVMEEFRAFNPHFVLMDISLPFMGGYHWCQEIRKISSVPIMFISSASDNMNIVMAMNMGGDDFVAKPFDRNVLVAKMQAILRRTYDFANAASFLEAGGASLNTDDNSLVFAGKKIALSKNEFRILLTLMKNKGKVVSREKLMEELWETDCFVDENTLTVNVGRLRRKLETEGLAGFIGTKHGVGYILEAE